MRRWGWSTMAAIAAAAAPATADPVTADGQAIAYATNASHTAADTDGTFDVYLWNRGTLQLTSPGPDTTGRGSYPDFISDDGSVVVFHTEDALLPEDVDTSQDLYAFSNGALSLVSTGPSDPGAGAPNAEFGGASRDGSLVYFSTTARLTPDDQDAQRDIYVHGADGQTRLASTTPAGVAGGWHWPAGLSADGQRLLEVTDEQLVPQDTDTAPDVYERSAGAVTLLSQGPSVDDTPSANGDWAANVTPDARSVVFTSWDRLTPGDQNDDIDLYQRRDGRTLLVTARADGVSPACPTTPLDPPSRRPACEPDVYGQTDDGSKVLFWSPKPLGQQPIALGVTLPGGDGGLFVRTSTSTTLLDNAPYTTERMSPDGARYVIETRNQHAAADTDSEPDLYALESGTWQLLTPGTTLAGDHVTVSRDAKVVYFDTEDGLVPQDTDGTWDTYVTTKRGPRLASTGPADDLSKPAYTADLGISADGSRMFFSSMRPMTVDDTDDHRDLYLREGDVTQLLTP